MAATPGAVRKFSDLGWWSNSKLFRKHLQEVCAHESEPESSTPVGWTQVAHVCACTMGQTETLSYSYFLPIPVTFCNPLMLAATNLCNICSTLRVINSLENLNVLLPARFIVCKIVCKVYSKVMSADNLISSFRKEKTGIYQRDRDIIPV